jgi:hypothetical protein
MATQPYDWCVAYLGDARDSEAIDRDTPDAIIEREAFKLERLVYQVASSFVDNEFDETHDDLPCIKRTYFGGSERLTLDDLATNVVQDLNLAADIARAMLAYPDGVPYAWGADGEPERHYEEFEVCDRPHLEHQLAKLDEEAAK